MQSRGLQLFVFSWCKPKEKGHPQGCPFSLEVPNRPDLNNVNATRMYVVFHPYLCYNTYA